MTGAARLDGRSLRMTGAAWPDGRSLRMTAGHPEGPVVQAGPKDLVAPPDLARQRRVRACEAMGDRGGAVYIMTNRTRRVLYTGVTADLPKRVYEHRTNAAPGSFTAKYRAHVLVYYEAHDDILGAIQREKQIKGWVRRKKLALIEAFNPEWRDLSDAIA
jgi:putative endonuclease